MKRQIIPLFLALFLCGNVAAQYVGNPVPTSIPGQPNRVHDSTPIPDLPKFNLQFSGGSPYALIAEINRALTNSPVNAIIPTEDNDIEIPPMILKNVNVSQVFEALAGASQKIENHPMAGIGGYPNNYRTQYGFRTLQPAATNSVWFFYADRALKDAGQPDAEKICRFYPLRALLQDGLKINDVTTAIKAGYRMLHQPEPELNFHEETHLLIAAGSPASLKLIEDVLSALQGVKPKTTPTQPTPGPQSATKQ